jgi:hypothetical protein
MFKKFNTMFNKMNRKECRAYLLNLAGFRALTERQNPDSRLPVFNKFNKLRP